MSCCLGALHLAVQVLIYLMTDEQFIGGKENYQYKPPEKLNWNDPVSRYTYCAVAISCMTLWVECCSELVLLLAC